MAQSSGSGISTASAIACGAGTAAVWYAASSALLPGVSGFAIPELGALALAAIIPAWLLRRPAVVQRSGASALMSQRFAALDRHASINIVDESGNLTEVNDRMVELTGYSREELVGSPVAFLYGDGAREIAASIHSRLSRGLNWEGETPLRHKSGRVLYTQTTIMPLFGPDGNWSGSISVRTDISRTNELIAERHTAETLYELRDDIWIIDSETETFNYMNRAAENRIGKLGESYRDRSFEEFCTTHDIRDVFEACRALHDSAKSSTKFETDLMGVSAEVIIKFLPGGKETGRYLIVLNDISERIAQDRLKSEFISTVSHELRSPLTSIKGAMGLLLSKSAGELPEKALSLLNIAHRNADRLILIINDMLDLDKITSGEMELNLQDADASALVQEADAANKMLQQRFGVQVDLIGVDRAIPLRTDPVRFIQVLTNLLSNAYKFSKPNDRITVRIRDEDDHIGVSVEDQGNGIPKAEQHKIFSRFSDMTNSDRAAKGGTGLGLNICKAIVESMGGTIGFEIDRRRRHYVLFHPAEGGGVRERSGR